MLESFIYIMTNRKNGTLYIGVTNDIIRRVYEHKYDIHAGFTKKYQLHTLVYYECFDHISAAITREKELKRFRRAWKIKLIEKLNPAWRDLYDELI